MIGAVAKIWLKPDRKDEYLAVLREDGEESELEQPGPMRFDIYEDPADSTVIYLYEAWPDREAWEAHMESNVAVKKLAELSPECVVKKELLIPGWTDAFWPE